MAVMQTSHGRIIGLIIEKDSQPKPEPVAEIEPVTEPVKKPGRPPRK